MTVTQLCKKCAWEWGEAEQSCDLEVSVNYGEVGLHEFQHVAEGASFC